MELRGQDNKEMGMPSSFSYKNQLNKDSYSSAPVNSATGERRRDRTVRGDPNLPQTLDDPLSVPNPRRDPDPDPVSASTATTGEIAAAADSRSPPTPEPQPVAGPTSATISFTPLIRYKECLKNHAASMGGHVVDGCGEFMPSGEEGTPEALKCAACECHRSFHRKEINGESQYAPSSYYYTNNNNNTRRNAVRPPPRATPLHHQRFSLGLSASPPAMSVAPLMMSFGGGGPAESSSEDLHVFHFSEGGQQPSHPHSSKKRFRTKFSQEQKKKMMEFADKLGWKIQKQDDEQVQQFCDQVGVKRQVLKVWMHNNKQVMKRTNVRDI